LAWRLFLLLTGHDTASWWCAAVFAAHPVNTNAVTYIAGRADSMALAGMLGALIFAIHCRQSHHASPIIKGALFAGSTIAYTAALFSRENAMMFPLLVFCMGVILPGPQTTQRFRRALEMCMPHLILLACFAAWRVSILAMLSKPAVTDWAVTVLTRLQIPFRALATYAGLMVWPSHLQMDRHVVHPGWDGFLLTLTGMVLVVGLLAWMRWSYRRAPVALFGLCWFVVMIAPMLGGLGLVATVAEHWLYTPSIGLYLAIGATAIACRQHSIVAARWIARPVVVPSCMIVVTLLALRTSDRNEDWSTGIAFYSKTRQAAPHSPAVRNNLSLELVGAGQWDRALTELEEAARLAPSNASIKNNLALCYWQTGQTSQALAKIKESLALNPNNPATLERWAAISEQRGDLNEARHAYRALLAVSVRADTRLDFARFLMRHDAAHEAVSVLETAFELEPGHPGIFNTLGVILAGRGQHAQARQAFELAAGLDRHSPDSRINLGRLALQLGDVDDASHRFNQALNMKPDDTRALYQLAMIRWKQGRLDEARALLSHALACAPRNTVLNEALLRLNKRQLLQNGTS
jgi:Flp pilus assembly protein TadD